MYLLRPIGARFLCCYDYGVRCVVIPEAMMPNHGRPDQVGIFSQRGEEQLGFFKGNEAAAPADGLANAIEKKIRTLHNAAAQHDCIRGEEINQVGEAEAKIFCFAIYSRTGQCIAFAGQLTDSFCGQPGAMRIVRRRSSFQPCGHGRPRCQRFPAPAIAARAEWPRRIDYLVADFRMGAVHAAVEFSIQNNSPTDAGTQSHINQARLVFARAPARLAQRSGVPVIFHGGAYIENSRQIFH